MIGWIDQHRDMGGLGHQIMEEPQPLGRNFSGEKIDPGRVAARLGKAGDQTKFDGVVADTWGLINPWVAFFDVGERLTRPWSKELSLRLPYPRWLGAWPACALL